MKVSSPEKGGLFFDCTFGCGGYSNAILSFPKTRIIALDRDPNTKEYGRISILVNFRLKSVENFKISNNCFFPKPSVDSKIIVFTPKIKDVSVNNLGKSVVSWMPAVGANLYIIYWQDEWFIISKKKFRENAIILEVFTNKFGKVSGIVYGGNSRKIKNYRTIKKSCRSPIDENLSTPKIP